MAGKSSNSGNWSPGSPGTRYKVSGKNREFYTFENAPGVGAYATGGTLIDGGDGHIYHIFTGDGTFVVNRPPAIIDSVDYLIVAGGGAGGNPFGGGGGGGGFLFGQATVSNAPGSYPITVGGGGSYPQPTAPLRSGSPSTAFGLTAAGGGGGAGGGPVGGESGAPGGSGGGSKASPASTFTATSGNTPATIPRQGYGGGSGPAPNNTIGSGGGGGAGGIGNPGTPASGAGNGGPGRIAPEFPSTIVQPAIPSPVLPAWQPLVGPSGYAAGGQGFPAPTQRTSPANSGYGSVGGAPNVGNGGSGIVCIRYAKSAPYQRATGGTVEPSTDPNHPGVWRHIFTTPGTFTVTDPSLQWIDYLAVGGGGGGGGAPAPLAGGGGGAGGFVTSIESFDPGSPFSPSDSHAWNPGYSLVVGEQMPVGAQPGVYPVSIGPGGAGGGTAGGTGTTGTNTTIGAPGPTQIIAYGGGGGANASPATLITGGAGGSGGGGAKSSGAPTGSAPGGAATPTYPTPAGDIPTQGAYGGPTAFPAVLSGGAGGGVSQSPGGPLVGGTGWYSVISPPSYGTPGPVAGKRYFAGGGGGYPGGAAPASGGGGAGAPLTPRPATANTGGGGGAGGPSAGGLTAGTGGSGIVIIQYTE